MTIILFLLILTALIFIHELGHFLAAKWTGMKVEEFSIGFFEPRLFVKKIGETEYSIRPFLLGGYVKIFGENDPENKTIQDPRAFANRSWWAQMVTLVAGVAMNLVLAYLLFVLLAWGRTTVATDDPQFAGRTTNNRLIITDVAENSPARLAGIEPGAQLIEIRIKNVVSKLTSATATASFISLHQEDALTLTYKNPGENNPASTTLALVFGIIENKKALGISLEEIADVHIPFTEAVVLGGQNLWMYTKLTFGGLKDLVVGASRGENVLNSLSGPIGIASMVGQAQKVGYESVLLLVAFLSLNLAVLNILPLPALDGGQMVKVSIEKLLRRKLSNAHTALVNALGFFFLIGLLVVVSIHDIIKLF